MRNKLWLILIFLFCFALSKGQDIQVVITSAGNYSSNDEASINWTLGECIIGTYEGTLSTINHGFIIVPISTSVIIPGINFSVYPNPASQQIVLELDNIPTINLAYFLYNIEGKLLMSNLITKSNTVIPLDALLPATYILIILKGGSIVGSYKIIKQ